MIENIICYHCGEDCGSEPIQHEEKSFCCLGCKTVFSILSENEMATFYTLNEKAGKSQKAIIKEDYAVFDDAEVVNRFLEFNDGKTGKVRLLLPQIHCSSCIWVLEQLQRLDEHILQSRVNFPRREVTIVFDQSKTNLKSILELLASIGYPPAINFQTISSEHKIVADKSIFYKIGLAGFAFGNIMLLSFPEYLGLDESLDSSFARFFGYLNLILSLPVIFYSGADYLNSAWQGLKQKHLNMDVPISLGILALFGRSAYEILSHTGAGYLDSLAGLIFFLLIGKWFQRKTYDKISYDRDYKSYFPISTLVWQDKEWKPISIDKIKEGDTIKIRHSEIIPVDGLLISDQAEIDYSFVTGESTPVPVMAGEHVFAGGKQMSNAIKITVNKRVNQSYLTQLWNEDVFVKGAKKGEVNLLADKVAKYFTICILLIAFSTFGYWWSLDKQIAYSAFTAVLIVACPCAVALAIPFTFGNVIRILGRQSFYLKNTQIIEKVGLINHVVFDKTGTITGASSKEDISYTGDELNTQQLQQIKSLVSQSIHPLSVSISQYLGEIKLLEIKEFSEDKGRGLSGVILGEQVKVGSTSFMGLHEERDGALVSINGHIVGQFIFEANFRTGLSTVLKEIKKDAKITLLTGDNTRHKLALTPFFSEENMHFRRSPKHKLDFVHDLLTKGEHVMMIGDGLNDAGALQQSDVGIVIAEDTNNFTPACDIIVTGSRFADLGTFLLYIKKSKLVVFGAYLLALVYNIIGLTYAVKGLLSPVIAAILMPLSSITIVLFGFGMSTLLAYLYGVIKKSGSKA